MRAVQFEEFGTADVLSVKELPVPTPSQGEVLLKVSAAGVSFVDIRQRQGAYNRAETRVGGVQLPNVPGLQAVGRVVAVGEGVDPDFVGQRMLAFVEKGAYAEHLVAPAAFCAVAPEEADDAVLALLPMQGVTAYLAVTASAALGAGESVLVHAAGSGVGSLAVQIAKILGAGTVLATAASEEKRTFALEIGADHAVDYSVEGWTRTVLDLTNGGVDVLLESIGGAVFEQNFDCLAWFGRYVIYGSTRGPGAPLEPRRLMTKCQSLIGLYMPIFMRRPELIREGLTFLAKNAAERRIKMRIAEQLPLSDATKAHKLLETKAVTGGIVLRP